MNRPTHVAHGTVLDDTIYFSLREFCYACGARSDWIIAMVEEGLLIPEGPSPASWRFPGPSLTRAQVAVRLYRDLGVNWAGAALALDLMEELDALRRERRRRLPHL